MTLISHKPFKRPFDTNFVEKLHTELSKEIPDLEIVWKYGREEVFTPKYANNAKIIYQGKALYVHHRNGNGILNINRVREKKQAVLNIAKRVNLVSEAPSFMIPSFCMFLYFVIFFSFLINYFVDSYEDYWYLPFICLIILISGISFSYQAVKKRLSETKIAIGYIISCIGIGLLAPISLLILPFMIAIRRNELYKLTH
ncbi:hypothetical protein JGH11_06805 [Dysgonomonas sp. Marseille-P4677]|uniref:hypothetical protein n=1 Tax=Dysgonomonas sp. Marseille-P4677 TaxID=2364790 RepID=UPI001912CB10|nr:hypothetical protein [Dysgonomonas sp. Marseille-P4677]MBK5720577.1 hypothetical protein [Dysgonomonas sp. Marseille-P4677]